MLRGVTVHVRAPRRWLAPGGAPSDWNENLSLAAPELPVPRVVIGARRKTLPEAFVAPFSRAQATMESDRRG